MKHQNSHDPCRVCEILIVIARRHFHNNVKNIAALQTQLELECNNLVQQGFSASEVQHCVLLVDDHIDDIYNELNANVDVSVHQNCLHLMQCIAKVSEFSLFLIEKSNRSLLDFALKTGNFCGNQRPLRVSDHSKTNCFK